MTPSRSPKAFLLYCLCVFFLFILASNYIWLHLNVKPPVDDEAIHVISALQYRFVIEHAPADMLPVQLARVDKMYPPFFPALAGILASLTGHASMLMLCSTNMIFLGILFFSFYLIGCKIGDYRVGILAAMIFSLYPMVFLLGRMFMLETALTALVTLTFALILCSEGFLKTGFSALGGLALGVGMLTKQTCIIFVFGPALGALLGNWRGQDSSLRRDRFINFIVFLSIALIISLPWYLADLRTKYNFLHSAAFDVAKVPNSWPIFSWDSLTYYVRILVREQISLCFFIAFCGALLLGAWKVKRKLLFLSWLILPYLVLTLFPNKFYYYSFPYLPVFAVMTAFGLLAIKDRFVRHLVIFIFLIVGGWQFLTLSFRDAFNGLSPIMYGCRYAPQMEDYKFSEIVSRLKEYYPGTTPLIGVIYKDKNIGSGRNQLLDDASIVTNISGMRAMLTLWGLNWPVQDVRLTENENKTGPINAILSPRDIHTEAEGMILGQKFLLRDVFFMPDSSKVYLYIDEKATHGQVRSAKPEEYFNTNHNHRLEIIPDLFDLVIRKKIVTRYAIEEYGLDWISVSQQLVLNGWADQMDAKSVRLKTGLDIERDKMAAVFGKDFGMLMPILQESFKSSWTLRWRGKDLFSRRLTEISDEHTRLALQERSWRVFWQGAPITKGLSVYTSIRMRDRWFDSRQLDWFVYRVEEKRISAIAFHSPLPVWQLWDFSVEGDRVLWTVRFVVLGNLSLDREQANVMLSNGYAQWFSPGKRGNFPDSFNKDYGGDWQVLEEIMPGSDQYIGVRDPVGSLPEVVFSAENMVQGMKGGVINSDDKFSGRVLQYAVKHKESIIRRPGIYEYFKGYIELGTGLPAVK